MNNTGTQCAVVLAALAIIVGSASWIATKRTRGAAVRRSVEEAVQTWEAEGGAVPVADEA
jgi:hypothetical protein